MATQKAELVNLFSYKPYSSSSIVQTQQQSLSLVKDPYSGKYYGNDTYANMASTLKQAESYFTDIISRAETNTGDFWSQKALLEAPKSQIGFSMPNAVSPYEEAKLGLEGLKGHTIDASKYVQKPMMVESFNAHPEGWNKYFESAYKSPRIAEDNATAAQRQSEGISTSNQLVSSNLGIRKEVGTGVGRGTVGLNPFGQLDAGLNI